jgi:hypothetical protein
MRRLTAGLVVVAVVALNDTRLGERAASTEIRIITLLRSLSAAQLLHASNHRGQYADRLESLVPAAPRHGYVIELFTTPDHYAVTAVPPAGASGPRLAFCMDDSGRIYLTPAGPTPVVEGGQCKDTSRPLQ